MNKVTDTALGTIAAELYPDDTDYDGPSGTFSVMRFNYSTGKFEKVDVKPNAENAS